MIEVLTFMGGLGCIALAAFLWEKYGRRPRFLPGQHPSDLKPYPWPNPPIKIVRDDATGKPTVIPPPPGRHEVEAEEDRALERVVKSTHDLDHFDKDTLEKANRAQLRRRLSRQ